MSGLILPFDPTASVLGTADWWNTVPGRSQREGMEPARARLILRARYGELTRERELRARERRRHR